MPRFLHLSDVHLGLDRYDRPERTKDFFLAFKDALEKYAIAPQVDFVLIAGDLFEQRNILPGTLNQAQICFEMLKEAGIPVLAIEGNHDNRPYGTKTSWLRYLADWGYLILLEPDVDPLSGETVYEPWTEEQGFGAYIDLACGVRVMGSQWYGASAPQAIQKIAAIIPQLPPGPKHTVMMFHHGLEGQIARYTGALRYQDVLPLKQAGVDYLALGHIHKNYTVEGWIFNPGSVEANSIAENRQQTPRGVYLVEMDETGIRAELKQDYYQRPIVRLSLEATKQQTQAELVELAIDRIQAAAAAKATQGAIAELRISGQVGFNRLDLNVRELQTQLHEISQALIFMLKFDAIAAEYDTPIAVEGNQPPPRLEIETQVFADLLAGNANYSQQPTQLAKRLIELKEQILDNQPEADLYELAQDFLRAS
ncbi:MAG: DNA repair exonuclease [Leptolyngbyaceae bacterium]|nr:DNA repair exonuclease [Leptolyngbyaceae bacterium]